VGELTSPIAEPERLRPEDADVLASRFDTLVTRMSDAANRRCMDRIAADMDEAPDLDLARAHVLLMRDSLRRMDLLLLDPVTESNLNEADLLAKRLHVTADLVGVSVRGAREAARGGGR